MTRIIIAGSREFTDYRKMCVELDNLGIHMLSTIEPIEIVSGHAMGADTLGERFAKYFGYPLKIFPADWNTYGKSAGYRRNEEMAKYAAKADKGILVAFPVGESRGTRHMINLANQYGLKVHIFES